MNQLLTHSRQGCFKVCRRQHYYSYELGVRRALDGKALRMGSAHHDAIEALGQGRSLAEACDRIHARYDVMPEEYDSLEWEYERETLLRLACAYEWRWQDDKLEYLATERAFDLPLTNPATGKPTTNFRLAGKIDGIVKDREGRVSVKESKLLGDDIGIESDLWRRLRIDHQITLYVYAARQLGFQVDAVLYDVTRKPSIAPTQVPLLDELGAKIVLDQYGLRVKTERGQFRQTGDKEKGYVLQSRPMTPEEWGQKLTNDIAERPDFYFHRREIARLDCDIEEYRRELWDIQLTMREAQREGKHYRTVNVNTCKFCAYQEPCFNGIDLAGETPAGFVRVSDVHPELGGTENGDRTPADQVGSTTPATCESTAPAERSAEALV